MAVQKGTGEIVLEVKELNEEVERLPDETSVVHAKSRQCELLAKRLSALTTELEDAKAAAQGKERLLELKEQEYLKLANVVQDLQSKLEIEVHSSFRSVPSPQSRQQIFDKEVHVVASFTCKTSHS